MCLCCVLVHRLWKKLDKNGDGQLDEYEIRHLAKLLYTPTKAEIDAAVAKFDTNHDTRITFDEFVNRLSTVTPSDEAAADHKHRSSKIELTEHGMAYVVVLSADRLMHRVCHVLRSFYFIVVVLCFG
jgi:hypothetical protein